MEANVTSGQEKSTVVAEEGSAWPRDSVSEEEKRRNPEWFCGKSSKTPERYLTIRNSILDGWTACRPHYLTKTNARKQLTSCGDVNAIGRVHGYLESVGAINVGCVDKEKSARPVKRVPRTTHTYVTMDEADEDKVREPRQPSRSSSARKRRARQELATWDDPDLAIRRGGERVKRVAKRPDLFYPGEDDPFRLVSLEYYNQQEPAPFTVHLSSDALLVMDFHSHLAYTEIIGLLGGTFESNEHGKKVLRVKSVFPCRSISTGIQCEMDPVSEMEARDVFEQKGLRVVGWYHSHPKFEPNPSVRDIENQTSYQTLFRDEVTRDEPFIGVIVTPFDPEMATDLSRFQYLHVSHNWDSTYACRVPYACMKTIDPEPHISPDVLCTYKTLMEEYIDYEHKIDMTLMYGSEKTRLDKLVYSLRTHVHASEEETETFVANVRHIISGKDMVVHEHLVGNSVSTEASPDIVKALAVSSQP